MIRSILLSFALLLAGCGSSTARQSDSARDVESDSIAEAVTPEITLLFAGTPCSIRLSSTKRRSGAEVRAMIIRNVSQ